jgi:hypothetical protein
MSKRNLCFYSNKDKWSKAFLEELAKTNWASEFQFICVDPGETRPNLPKWLKQVPTLVIDGDQEPIKTDTEVMNWLYERKMKEMPKNSSGSGGANVTSSTAAIVNGEPESWLGNEMSGMGSARYSFIDSDTSTGGNGGSTIPGTFGFLNGSSSPGDRQSAHAVTGMNAGAGTRTKKEQQFDKQLDLYKQNRDSGMRQPPARQ